MLLVNTYVETHTHLLVYSEHVSQMAHYLANTTG